MSIQKVITVAEAKLISNVKNVFICVHVLRVKHIFFLNRVQRYYSKLLKLVSISIKIQKCVAINIFSTFSIFII